MNKLTAASIAIAIICCASCGGSATEREPAAAESPAIAWFEGDVRAAFDAAREENKPIFLYWGAVWCPPCNRVKATIFTRPEFIAKSRLFIPVYLDGDTERAQIWGDKFGVMGYPTIMVFDSGGNEITRIPGGIDIEAFAGVLDLALKEIRPVKDALRAVLTDSPHVTGDDFKLLAYHSWEQDRERLVPEEEIVETFKLLEERTPSGMPAERSRFFVQYLMAALRGEEELTAAQKKEALARLEEILGDPELVRANLDFFRYYAGFVVGKLTSVQSPDRAQLMNAWLAAMDRIWLDERCSVTERLGALTPQIEFCTLDDKEACMPPELVACIKERVAWADMTATEQHERHTAINTAARLLTSAGLRDDAKRLLLAEMDNSEAPYYLMGWLADLAAEAGDAEEAVDWLRRAYGMAPGRATRFQWGADYLIGLMELTPQEADRIESEAVTILEELLALDDAFNGRNRSRLERLGEELAAWNEDGRYDSQVASIRRTVRSACDTLEAESQERASCENFLAES